MTLALGRRALAHTWEVFVLHRWCRQSRKCRSHQLDGRKAPTVPVLVVGINSKEAHRAGVARMNRHLQHVGMQSRMPMTLASAPALAALDITKLTRIRVQNDQEPWVSGPAEMFAVVSGMQPNQAAATLAIVALPYLDREGTD